MSKRKAKNELSKILYAILIVIAAFIISYYKLDEKYEEVINRKVQAATIIDIENIPEYTQSI